MNTGDGMTVPSQNRPWIAHGSTSIVPPADYWAHLAGLGFDRQIEELRQQSDRRLNEFTVGGLPPPKSTAVSLLNRVAADGWISPTQRQRCPNCNFDLSAEQATQTTCPNCVEPFSDNGGVITETAYIRNLAPSRSVDWVVVIHGMTTTGAWQEAFSWHLATTWGQSVPIAIYKYGFVIAGVIMAWQRGRFQRELRDKLAVMRDEAKARGFTGKPDAVAHSFGTWLLGHLLEDELKRKPAEQLKFGRIILTGCVLRPDFDWGEIKEAGLVDDVLNHYGSRDPIVPVAHMTIWDSGPSGRRGFDGDQVINVRADGYGHSDLFSIEHCVIDGKSFQACTGVSVKRTHLEHAYNRYWRPFLTLPRQELRGLPDQANPPAPWRRLPWLLRGTIFPFFALPLVAALMALVVACLGRVLWEAWKALAILCGVSVAGLIMLLAAVAILLLWRRSVG